MTASFFVKTMIASTMSVMLLVSACLLLPTVGAWVSRNTHSSIPTYARTLDFSDTIHSTTTTTTSTTLFMFDWMNPNKGKKEESSDNNSLFGNMFKPTTTTTTTSPAPIAEESAKEDVVVATAAATVKAPVVAEEEKKTKDTKENALKEEPKQAIAATSKPSETAPVVDTNSPIHHGRVSWFDPLKGYGYIIMEEDDNGNLLHPVAEEGEQTRGIFVHQTSIQAPDDTYYRKLYNRESVEFRVTTDDGTGKPRAIHVTGPKGSYVKTIRRQIIRQQQSNA